MDHIGITVTDRLTKFCYKGDIIIYTVAELGDMAGKLKPIEAAVDEEPWFSPKMLQAAQWLADFYLCSLAEMMRLFMPGKSGIKITVIYQAVPEQGKQ